MHYDRIDTGTALLLNFVAMSSILFLKWSAGTPPFGWQDKRLTLLLQNKAIQGPTLAVLRNIGETPGLQEIGITQRECR